MTEQLMIWCLAGILVAQGLLILFYLFIDYIDEKIRERFMK